MLAAKMSAFSDMMEESKVSEKARAEILSDLVDETTKQVNDITVQASTLFLIEAESEQKVEQYTTDIRKKAEEIGAEVAALEESPKKKIIAMDPELPTLGEFIEEYCITIDAATVVMMQMIEPPRDLLDELYDESKDPIYLL